MTLLHVLICTWRLGALRVLLRVTLLTPGVWVTKKASCMQILERLTISNTGLHAAVDHKRCLN
jgi:hypothetical protein